MVAIGNFEVESYSKFFQLCVSNEELKETAARICRDYLTGAWKTINTEEIKFKRISGGLSNFLFYVSLPDGYDSPLASSSSTEQLTNSVTKRVRKDSGPSFAEPKEILLRIYGQTHGEHALETMLTESVVFTLLSERNLGPKLHGIFPGGRIEQYIPARPLTTLELSDYRISMKIAEKMASIHSLNIPVSKEPDWLWKSMDRWLQSAEAILAEDANDHKSIIEEVKQTKLSKEVAWLKSIILNADYQVVFCHNDLQEGNILFKEMSSRESSRENSAITASDDFDDLATDGPNFNAIHSSRELNGGMLTSLNGKCRKRSLASTDSLNDLDSTQDSVISNNSEDCDPDLFIIDYEYCAYNYRGFDLANHFVEWTIDYKNEQYPYYYYKASQYPTNQQRHDFISSYLKKVAQIDNESYTPTQEDIEELDNEVTVFTMVSHLFWTLWSIVNVHQNIEFGYWDYALTRLREYNVAKNKFKSNNGTIVKDD